MNKYLEKIAKVSAFHDTSHDADKQARSVSMPYNFARRLHLSDTRPSTHEDAELLHTTPIGHGVIKQAEDGSSNGGPGIGTFGAMTAGAGGALYGNRVYNKAKTLSPMTAKPVGIRTAFKQTVATDVSTGISKMKSLSGLMRSRFPLRAL